MVTQILKNLNHPTKKKLCPEKSHCFFISDRYGVSLLTKLRVELSDLRSHRFDHNFNCPSPICACGIEDETVEHYLTRCPRFSCFRVTLMDSISGIVNPEIINLPNDHLTRIMVYGSKVYNTVTNKLILEATIRFI